MDGCSQDNTLRVAHSFSDERIRIYSEPDSGVYDAMNKGIEKAQGKWLYFLGSDDRLYNESVLQHVCSALKEYNFVYGNVHFVHSRVIWDGVFTREKLLFEKNICHQSIFYKRELLDRLGGYNLHFEICADWDLNIRCFSFPGFKPCFMDTVVAYYDEKSGISAGNIDMVFAPMLPRTYVNEIESIKKSKSYRAAILLSKLMKKLKPTDYFLRKSHH
jgi:glycosyltransferase involved in cell wall biosynthesis